MFINIYIACALSRLGLMGLILEKSLCNDLVSSQPVEHFAHHFAGGQCGGSVFLEYKPADIL